ncbi:MAG: hypothetical protein KDJ36_19925, partial [Hyphomicrobiaceae bacterium]|nr:hypothetical protein [Hyphomicrobiaceae bacterium]
MTIGFTPLSIVFLGVSAGACRAGGRVAGLFGRDARIGEAVDIGHAFVNGVDIAELRVDVEEV